MQHQQEERYYTRPWKEIALELSMEYRPDRTQELATELLRALSLPPFVSKTQQTKSLDTFYWPKRESA